MDKRLLIFTLLFAVVIIAASITGSDSGRYSLKPIIQDGGSGGSGGVRLNTELDDLPLPFVVNNHYQNVAIVYGDPGSPDYGFVLQRLNEWFNEFVFEGETIPIVSSGNSGDYNYLILVGSPCYNQKVAEFMNLQYPACGQNSGIPIDQSYVALKERNGQVALIIASDETDRHYYESLFYLVTQLDELQGTEMLTGGWTPIPVTYDGVLDMLNTCQFIDMNSDTTFSCNQQCNDSPGAGSKCIFGEMHSINNPLSSQVIPCDQQQIPNVTSLRCVCCSP